MVRRLRGNNVRGTSLDQVERAFYRAWTTGAACSAACTGPGRRSHRHLHDAGPRRRQCHGLGVRYKSELRPAVTVHLVIDQHEGTLHLAAIIIHTLLTLPPPASRDPSQPLRCASRRPDGSPDPARVLQSSRRSRAARRHLSGPLRRDAWRAVWH